MEETGGTDRPKSVDTSQFVRRAAFVTLGIVLGVAAVLAIQAIQGSTDQAAGPRQNRDHWRSAYGVYSCLESPETGAPAGWLPHFESNDDPLGIHSHDDGVISIHPFFPESSGKNAVVGHFFDAMRAELHDDRFVLPDGTVLEEDTPCADGSEATAHIRMWPDVSLVGVRPATIITEDLATAYFRNLGEVWMFVLAPLDEVLPPLPSERYLAARWLGPAPGIDWSDRTNDLAIQLGSALPAENRVTIVDSVEVDDSTWIASSYPAATRSALVAMRYPERGVDPAGGEVVVLIDDDVRQTITTNGFPLTFITADENYVYAGRQGDGGYPHSALVRIDQDRFGADRIVFPNVIEGETPPDASYWRDLGWTLGSTEQRDLFDTGDYAAVFGD